MKPAKESSLNVAGLYCRYLKLQKGCSPNTVDAYMHDLDKLLTYCKQEQIDPMKVELSQLERFATSLFDIGIGPRSLARIFSGVRSFYRFLVLDGFLETDPKHFA